LRRATVADVAKRSGLSRMTLYRQYGDSAAVFRALLTRELTQVEAATAEAEALPSVRERLVEATVGSVRRIIAHPLMHRILEVDPELLLPLVVERVGSSQRVAQSHLRDLLVAGMAEGSIRTVDPDVATHVLTLAVQSFVFSARVTEAESDPEAVFRELRHLLDAYLQPPPVPPGTPPEKVTLP
jgi:AcrR family transcriptional regulator